MTTTKQQLDPNARHYFWEQGQRVDKLFKILSSNIITHHIKKWFSATLEVLLYIYFLIVIIFAIYLPLEITTNVLSVEGIGIDVGVRDEEVTGIFLLLKIILPLLALPLLFLAVLLRRNRKKNNLIREAFIETEKMKRSFDKARAELNL